LDWLGLPHAGLLLLLAFQPEFVEGHPALIAPTHVLV
jgi:hypothetical protein